MGVAIAEVARRRMLAAKFVVFMLTIGNVMIGEQIIVVLLNEGCVEVLSK